jgi:hypothetical protein
VAAGLVYEWLYLRTMATVLVGPPETGVRAAAGRDSGELTAVAIR